MTNLPASHDLHHGPVDTRSAELSDGQSDGRSDRRSGRVDDHLDVLPGQDRPPAVTAPEGVSPTAFAQPSSAARPAGLAGGVVPPRPERSGVRRRSHADVHKRTSRRRLAIVQADLSPRQSAILQSLGDHPFLLTAHLLALHFVDHATEDAAGRICRRVLARMAELRLIEHLERRIGGVRAGSASYVWRLGPVGHRLLAEAARDGDRPHARRKEPSLRHLKHCLAVADAAVALAFAARGGVVTAAVVTTEPACWRTYLGSSGAREILKPDLAAITRPRGYDHETESSGEANASEDFEDHWFIEIDRGTESLPTLLRKCQQYETYRRSGREQLQVGVFPWVVWVLPDERRIAKLRAALRTRRDLGPLLFRLTTPSSFMPLIAGDDEADQAAAETPTAGTDGALDGAGIISLAGGAK